MFYKTENERKKFQFLSPVHANVESGCLFDLSRQNIPELLGLLERGTILYDKGMGPQTKTQLSALCDLLRSDFYELAKDCHIVLL